MDEWKALNTFWNSFTIPAYDESTVPDDATMPYITYESGISELDYKITLNASLWYQSTSWQDISQKAKEISNSIGGGTGTGYVGGRLWITRSTPFARRMDEPNDPSVRRIVLQIEAEFQSM